MTVSHHTWQLPVTDKNPITEGLTVKQTIYLLKSRMTPPPPPLKILNRICIDLKNDPNGPEKNGFPLKNGKIPCLIIPNIYPVKYPQLFIEKMHYSVEHTNCG